MGCSDTQELFLVEFLIDRVNIPSVQAMQDDYLNVKTCIEFKVMSFSLIELLLLFFYNNDALFTWREFLSGWIIVRAYVN